MKWCLQFLLQKQYLLPPKVSYVICMRVNALVGSIWVPQTGHLSEQRVSKNVQSCTCKFLFTNTLIGLINHSKGCLGLGMGKGYLILKPKKSAGINVWNGE